MRLVLLLALILIGALFAGCLGAEDDSDPASDGGSEEQEDGEQKTGENGNGEARDEGPRPVRPEAILSANISQGAAPLNLTLTLDAEHPTPDNLSWVLTTAFAADNETGEHETLEEGIGLPLEHNRTLESVGNHTFSLTVADGDEQSQANVTVEVQESGPNGPVVTVSQGNTGSSQGTAAATLTSGDQWQFPVEPTDATTGYIVEVTWDATEIYNEDLDLWIRHEDGGMSVPPGAEELDSFPPGGPIVSDHGGSPLRIEVPIDLLEEPGVYEIMVRAHSQPAGYADDQPFLIHIATFEGIPFDEDFTMIG